MDASRSQVANLKGHIVQVQRSDYETKNKIDGINSKLNDIITLMQTSSWSGSAVKRKRISGGDIGRQPIKPKELFTPIQIFAREETFVTGSTG